jgi:hypothetical protein
MKKCLLVLAALTVLSSAPAQFFGGYADGVTSVPTGKNTIGPALRMVYDDFTFDQPGNIIAFEMVGLHNTGSPVGMYYEIRSGVSAGNGGTLLYFGDNLSAVGGFLPLDGSYGTPPAGPVGFGYGWYDSGPTSTIHLGAGTYWIGMAPLESFGSFDVTSTVGLGAVGHPINNGNAFYYDSSNPSANFISMGANDFGLRIITDASTVPEPGTLSLISLAAMGFLGLRRGK